MVYYMYKSFWQGGDVEMDTSVVLGGVKFGVGYGVGLGTADPA